MKLNLNDTFYIKRDGQGRIRVFINGAGEGLDIWPLLESGIKEKTPTSVKECWGLYQKAFGNEREQDLFVDSGKYAGLIDLIPDVAKFDASDEDWSLKLFIGAYNAFKKESVTYDQIRMWRYVLPPIAPKTASE